MNYLRNIFAPAASRRRPRTSLRLLVSQPARLRFANGASAEEGALLDDLSAGGARVRTHLNFKVRERVTLLVNLGIGLNFELPARVIYRLADANGLQSHYGMRFIGASDEDTQRLSRYLDSQRNTIQFGVQAFSKDSSPP